MTRASRLVLGWFVALVCCSPLSAQETTPGFGKLVDLYRAGHIDQAVAGVRQFVAAVRAAPPASGRGFTIRLADEISDWIGRALSANDRQALEVALMLATETYFRLGADSHTPGVLERLSTTADLLKMISRFHDALSSRHSRSPFLRTWYLLWESYRHGQALLTLEPDYLAIGLRSFPDDAQLLLAAASRREVLWWNGNNNPERHPEGHAGSTDKDLRTAADWLRKSLAADPHLLEAQLHLGRVLFLLGDVDGANKELSAFLEASKEPAPRYLGLLFLGEVLERSDRAAGEAAFKSAIGLVQVPQSAHIALAHLAHAEGRRADAAEEIEKAFSAQDDGADPWWWYVRGQWWQYENHLKAARAMVVR